VELQRRPGGHEFGAGVHLCNAPGRREAVGQGEVGAAVAQAAEERRLKYLGHDGGLPRAVIQGSICLNFISFETQSTSYRGENYN